MQIYAYEEAHANFSPARFEPAFVTMPFRLEAEDRFFAIGSCFVRQMERSLRARGLHVTSTPPASPLGETSAGVHIVDRYYVPVMTQELRWGLGHAAFPDASLVDMPRGLCADLQLPNTSRGVARDRAQRRRVELSRYFARASDANVFIIDLARTDVSFDRDVALALNGHPPDWFARRHPERFEYQVWDFEDCLRALRELCALLLGLGDDRKVVLVVDPQSLSYALRPSDVTRSTVRMQALWVAAADQVARERSNVAYYPLFEALTWPDRSGVFDDHGHVREAILEEAMAAMLHAFGLYLDPTEDPAFDEAAYLEAHPDVAAAVSAGTIVSGYHHWREADRPRQRRDPEFGAASAEIDRTSLGVRIAATIPSAAPSARRFRIDVELVNTGRVACETAGGHPVFICYRWYARDGTWIEPGRSIHTPLTATLEPGDSIVQPAVIGTPSTAGRYTLALTLVKQNVAWFDDLDAANGQRSEVAIEGWDPDLPD